MNEIAKLREKTGLTQAGFAALFGLDNTTISKWEAGLRKPKSFMLTAIKAKVAEHLKGRKSL